AGVASGGDCCAIQERLREGRGGSPPPRRAVASCWSWFSAMMVPRLGVVGCCPWVGVLHAQIGWCAAHVQESFAPGARQGPRFRGAPGAVLEPVGERRRREGRGEQGLVHGPPHRRWGV